MSLPEEKVISEWNNGELSIVTYRMGVHYKYTQTVWSFREKGKELSLSKQDFFDYYWDNVSFLQFVIRAILQEYTEYKKGDDYARHHHPVVCGTNIANLIPEELGGSKDFCFQPNVSINPLMLGAFTIGNTSYGGQDAVAMVATRLIKSSYYLKNPVDLQYTQNLLKLLSKLDWTDDGSRMLHDLFPPDHMMSEYGRKGEVADKWYKDIYFTRYPSIEEQREKQERDRREYEAREKAEQERKAQEVEDAKTKKRLASEQKKVSKRSRS